MPFLRCGFSVAMLALCALLQGCAVGNIAMDPDFTESDVQGKVGPVRTAKSRAEVHALMGEAWISSEQWRVEVFRQKGTQKNLALVFPVPFPLPADTQKLDAYTLVTYAVSGAVEDVNTAFSHGASFIGISKPVPGASIDVATGDFLFSHTHGHTDTLAVSMQRFERSHSPGQAGGCRLLVSGERCPTHAYRTMAVCWPIVEVDHGGELVLQADDSETFEALIPFDLPTGQHGIHLSKPHFAGHVDASFSCGSGQTLFARSVGQVSEGFDVGHFLMTLKDGAATGSVEFSADMPGDFAGRRVLLYLDGRWLAVADSSR